MTTSGWIDSLQRIAGGQALSTNGVDLSAEHDTFYVRPSSLKAVRQDRLLLHDARTGQEHHDAGVEADERRFVDGFRQLPRQPRLANDHRSSSISFLMSSTSLTCSGPQQWFTQVELYVEIALPFSLTVVADSSCSPPRSGGKASHITSVPADATAFAERSQLFTIQFYASSQNYQPPYPAEGFTFLDNQLASITQNNGANWPYGCVSASFSAPSATMELMQLLFAQSVHELCRLAPLDPSMAATVLRLALPSPSADQEDLRPQARLLLASSHQACVRPSPDSAVRRTNGAEVQLNRRTVRWQRNARGSLSGLGATLSLSLRFAIGASSSLMDILSTADCNSKRKDSALVISSIVRPQQRREYEGRVAIRKVLLALLDRDGH